MATLRPASSRQREALRQDQGESVFAAASDLFGDEAEVTTPTVRRSLAGNLAAARLLLYDTWPSLTEQIAEAIVGDSDWATSRAELLNMHLLQLPLLAVVQDKPGVGLLDWAVVGVRELVGSPVAYAVADPAYATRVLPGFRHALVEAMEEGTGVIDLAKQILGLTNEDLARWVDVVPQTISNWQRGTTDPPRSAAATLRTLALIASTMNGHLKADRIPVLFKSNPVPLLGGMSYKDALDKGEFTPAEVLDVVRFAVGLEPLAADFLERVEGTAAGPVAAV